MQVPSKNNIDNHSHLSLDLNKTKRIFVYICICQQITDSQIKEIIQDGKAKTVEELASLLGMGESCGTCIIEAEKILIEYFAANPIKT